MPFNIAPSAEESREITYDDHMINFVENEKMVKNPSVQFLKNAPNVVNDSRDFTVKLPSIQVHPS
jgi:hypothetical protein